MQCKEITIPKITTDCSYYVILEKIRMSNLGILRTAGKAHVIIVIDCRYSNRPGQKVKEYEAQCNKCYRINGTKTMMAVRTM